MAYVVCFAVCIGVASLAADGTYCPVANVTERWTNGVAWKTLIEGPVTSAVVDESMYFAYSSVESPFPRFSAMVADADASKGWYIGNYSNSGITHVAFDVMRVGLDSEALLIFTCNNGHSWYRRFGLPSKCGVWEHVEVAMTFSLDWVSSSGSGSEAFDADRSQIKSVEIYSFGSGESAQELRVDNFKVVGPWEKGPMTADEMPLYWLLENGLAVESGQAGLDKDGDGFNNFAEYLAGTDPSDALSQFRLEIQMGADGKPELTWKRESYRAYTVFKSTDLTMQDGFAVESRNILSAGDKNRVVLSGDSDASGYYRVKVERQ